jgi:hypothetical protein
MVGNVAPSRRSMNVAPLSIRFFADPYGVECGLRISADDPLSALTVHAVRFPRQVHGPFAMRFAIRAMLKSIERQ